MCNTSDSDAAASKFASAARHYSPQASSRFGKLLRFKESIAELRHKHASYRTIARILRETGVTVSHNSIAQFCREVIGASPSCTLPCPPTVTTVSEVVRSPAKRTIPTTTSTTSDQPAPDRQRHVGPRIADPNTI
jgi:hypothetical protein